MKFITLLLFLMLLTLPTLAHALEPDDRDAGGVVTYEALTFSAFNAELYPASALGRYSVNYTKWVGNLRGVISLYFGDKLVGAILFLEDRAPLPTPEEQSKRGGYVLYYYWRDYWEVYNMLITYKSMGTYGSIFKKTFIDGEVLYGLNFSQTALEKNRIISR